MGQAFRPGWFFESAKPRSCIANHKENIHG